MYNQNCIDVKYVSNLSVAYLTRFFGSAGPIVKVEKNQNSKYVTIEFVNRYSVEKAMRFEGRVLDKDPIKIRIYKNKNLGASEASHSLNSHNSHLKRKDNFINIKETLENSGKFKEDIWNIIFSECNRTEQEDNQKLILSMLIWRLANFLMNCAKHIEKYKVNPRGNYLLFQLEHEIMNRLERKNGTVSSFNVMSAKQSVFELREGRAWLWYQVPYPNTEEGSLCQQSKIEAYSAQSKCTQKVMNTSSILGGILRGLYSCMMLYNSEETNIQTILQLKFELTTNSDDHFIGIVENIGVRDLLFDLLSYEQANSLITLSESCDSPQSFECSLRLIGCPQVILEEKGWCDFYQAVIWKRWTSQSNYYFHIEIKKQIDKLTFGQHNLYFDEFQFSCEKMCSQYKKYHSLHLSTHCKVFYIRKQKQETMTQSFEKVYEDDVMKIEDEMEDEPKKANEEGNFHEEVVLNLYMVEIRAQGHNALNQLKLEHYLLDYIEDSINAKGLIVASQEMAYKLAANIIQREKEGRLFEFAHSRFERYIGEELWRLYCKQNERKIKNNLVHYQLGRK